MKDKRVVDFVRVIILSIAVGGCSITPKRAYDGPELAKTEVARIRTYTFNTLLWDVDQKWLFLIPDQRLLTNFVDILPGRHSVKLHYQSNGLSYYFANSNVELNAVSGHVYLPRSEVVGEKVRFWLEDGGTDYEKRCPYKPNLLVQTQRAATPPGC